MSAGEPILDAQRRYYAARAPEYDDWWYRRGRFEVDRYRTPHDFPHLDLRVAANGHFVYGGGRP